MYEVLLPWAIFNASGLNFLLVFTIGENQRILVSDRPEFEFQQLLSIWTWGQVT